MTKHNSADILYELEKSSQNENYIINRENDTNTIIVLILCQLSESFHLINFAVSETL